MPELNEAGTSPDAATTDNAAPVTPAAPAAGETAAPSQEVAASEPNDEIARLDRELSDNLLKAREPEDESEPEKPKTEPEIEKPEVEPLAAAEEETVEVDPLAEQTGPRDLEALKKQFPRAQTVALEEIAKVEAKQWELQKKVDAIGGAVGIEIAKAVMPALLSANPGEKEADSTFQTLAETNPALTLEMSRQFLMHAIEEEAPDPATGLPTNIATGNALIKTRWPEHDVEKIDKLVKFDEAGLIDHEKLAEESELYRGESEAVKTLKAEVAALKEGKEQDKAKTENDARIETKKHYDKTVDYVSRQVMDAVVPIAEFYGWTATKEELTSKDPAVKQLAESKIVMGKMLTAYMNTRMRQLPEWASVEHLGKSKQAFTEDGQVRHLFTSNSGPLVTKLLAEFKEMVRILNPTFAKSFGSTRAAKLKEKTIRSGEAQTQIPPVKKVEEKRNGDYGFDRAAIDELDKNLDRDMRQARA